MRIDDDKSWESELKVELALDFFMITCLSPKEFEWLANLLLGSFFDAFDV